MLTVTAIHLCLLLAAHCPLCPAHRHLVRVGSKPLASHLQHSGVVSSKPEYFGFFFFFLTAQGKILNFRSF